MPLAMHPGAAKDYQDSNPTFALCAAIASLHWLSQGWGYEIDSSDVYAAYSFFKAS
jgi:hypothetical protein